MAQAELDCKQCHNEQKDEVTDKKYETQNTESIEEKTPVEYNLRRSSLVNRVVSERLRKEPRKPKPKSKPPPLSKYRRRSANARERTRMVDINDGFAELRSVLPTIEASSKMTKITTLRLALNYISALRHTLGYENDADGNSDAASTRSVSYDDLASDAASLPSASSSGDELCQSPMDGDFLSSEDLLAGDMDLINFDPSAELLLT
ncbi:helix-loop-helix protein delilah-like [Mytilus californianus]|uniref:helix-loop-helix protein delilah-like n=1 Tax=Mytilus californianus TaxID=6549 RepID=UPI0022457A05|nr:helix-loop-helix protein delilah-like [Mytilus californianus]